MPGVRRRLRLLPGSLLEDRVEISGPALHHLRVLRSRPGDTLYLFDGEGNEVEAELLSLDHDRAEARVVYRLDAPVESPLDLCLVQAVPVRLRKMDLVVRQTTELGVKRIVPVVTARGRAESPATRSRRDRWERIANAAAEQSGRREVPQIDEPVAFDALEWAGLPRPLLILDPAEADCGSLRSRSKASQATLMIGPEGGWIEQELAMARSAGAIGLGLGARVLRLDTAGVVAAAVVLHRWGDLG